MSDWQLIRYHFISYCTYRLPQKKEPWPAPHILVLPVVPNRFCNNHPIRAFLHHISQPAQGPALVPASHFLVSLSASSLPFSLSCSNMEENVVEKPDSVFFVSLGTLVINEVERFLDYESRPFDWRLELGGSGVYGNYLLFRGFY